MHLKNCSRHFRNKINLTPTHCISKKSKLILSKKLIIGEKMRTKGRCTRRRDPVVLGMKTASSSLVRARRGLRSPGLSTPRTAKGFFFFSEFFFVATFAESVNHVRPRGRVRIIIIIICKSGFAAHPLFCFSLPLLC